MGSSALKWWNGHSTWKRGVAEAVGTANAPRTIKKTTMVDRRSAVLGTIRGRIQRRTNQNVWKRQDCEVDQGVVTVFSASVLPERCNAHQGQHEANDLGCLQTMRSPSGAATGERHEEHIPACSIDGQK